jgi:NAD(P)H-dependent FMN reductase
MHGNEYLVVAGSTRPMRRSPVIAAWVAQLGASVSQTPFRMVDLKDLGLGLDDEPHIPAAGLPYASEATRRWSALVADAKGVVLVTPQYNWGYPAALKNAIDHLYREWRGKPVLLVPYGGHGGDKCAAQLRQVLGGMGVRLADATPGLHLARERIEANDGHVEPELDFESHREDVVAGLRELVAMASADAASA